MNGKICLTDSNVLVYGLVDLDKKKHIASKELLKRVEQGQESLIANFLILTETFHILAKYKGVVTATEMVRKLLSLEHLDILPLDHLAYFEALKRSKKYKLKFNDLIHYTTALLNNAAGIYSYDKDFDGLEIKRIEP